MSLPLVAARLATRQTVVDRLRHKYEHWCISTTKLKPHLIDQSKYGHFGSYCTQTWDRVNGYSTVRNWGFKSQKALIKFIRDHKEHIL